MWVPQFTGTQLRWCERLVGFLMPVNLKGRLSTQHCLQGHTEDIGPKVKEGAGRVVVCWLVTFWIQTWSPGDSSELFQALAGANTVRVPPKS